MKSRILFVDDKPSALAALQEMMYPMHHQWDLEFAQGGTEALAIMSQVPVDAVVADMRMPGMNGAELLDEVMSRYPQVVRIILSSQSDKTSLMKSTGTAHQYLSKPCSAEKLKGSIERAFAQEELLRNDSLKKLVSRMKSLPSMPTLYLRLMEELAPPEYTLTKIGKIISGDVGMTAKLLQLVNSAFFGLSIHVSNPIHATRLLGPEIIKGLIFSTEVFSRFRKVQSSCLSLEKFLNHAMSVAAFAKEIAMCENQDRKAVDNTFVAGMLHDTGRLVLAENLPDQYRKTFALASNKGITLWEAEQEIFGATHAEVGSYLLVLWGLPANTIEGLAFHHSPSESLDKSFSPLTAVHVANLLEHELDEEEAALPQNSVDLHYLEELGLKNRLAVWRDVCMESKQERQSQS